MVAVLLHEVGAVVTLQAGGVGLVSAVAIAALTLAGRRG